MMDWQARHTKLRIAIEEMLWGAGTAAMTDAEFRDRASRVAREALIADQQHKPPDQPKERDA